MSQDVTLVAISFTQIFPNKYNIHRQQKSFEKLDCFFPNNIKHLLRFPNMHKIQYTTFGKYRRKTVEKNSDKESSIKVGNQKDIWHEVNGFFIYIWYVVICKTLIW